MEHSVATSLGPDNAPLTANNLGGLIMRWKARSTLGIKNGAWESSLAQNFQTGYGDYLDNNGNQHHIGSFSTYDFDLVYRGVKNLKLDFGIKNVFDRNPPVAGGPGGYLYIQAGYDPSYYDARARFPYLKATWKFE